MQINPADKFYVVRRDRKFHCQDPVAVSYFTARGAVITEPRLHGDATIWINGKNVGVLFKSQLDAIKFSLDA